MKAAIYARVSTERQAERGTIGSQVEALRAHVTAAGDEPAGEYPRRVLRGTAGPARAGRDA